MRTWLATSTALLLATLASADNFSGNQLQGAKAQPPITERPATIVGPADGVTADTGTTILALQTGSLLYILGDSTLHQYELGAKSLKGSAVVKLSATGLAKSLRSAHAALVVPVTQLKSKESGLDDNAYKALKAKDDPEIRFDLKSIKLAADNTAAVQGDLTIAGSTQPIVLNAQAKVTDTSIELSGVQKVKMTDYQITPPSVSLVVTNITCSDEIEVHYDVTFASTKEEAAH